jgi:hypothetical protein
MGDVRDCCRRDDGRVGDTRATVIVDDVSRVRDVQRVNDRRATVIVDDVSRVSDSRRGERRCGNVVEYREKKEESFDALLECIGRREEMDRRVPRRVQRVYKERPVRHVTPAIGWEMDVPCIGLRML